jgi:hypothetical protein
MTNANKHVVIDLTNTLQTKCPCCPPPPPPPHDLQLAQTHSAISAATTLLATLSNLATTIALAAPLATPKTQNPNPAMIQAMPALPESPATTFVMMHGVLAHLATLAPVGVLAYLATLAPNPTTI